MQVLGGLSSFPLSRLLEGGEDHAPRLLNHTEERKLSSGA